MRRFTLNHKDAVMSAGAAASAALLAAVTGLIAIPDAKAYTPTLSPSGKQVRLSGARKLNLAGNPSNNSGIGADAFRNAVVRGLQRWASGAGGAVSFDYWQGSDGNVYEANSEYNGLSSVYFASQGSGDSQLDSGVIGLTQVWYDTETGEILETDVVLNDVDYRFTTDAGDTTGYGKGTYDYGREVFIENVLTHELGHAFGLSHTGSMQGTMLFLESPEQAHLSCDDVTGIRAVYPQGSVPAGGAVSGRVTAENGSGVFGAHVLAISARRGVVMASAVTGPGGDYRIAALEPGDYFLMVEPFYAGASALPGFYADVDPFVCGGNAYSRTFVTGSDGHQLQKIRVSAGGNASAPAVRVACGSGAEVDGPHGTSTSSGAPIVLSGSGTGGIVDRVHNGVVANYRFTAVSGKLEVRVLSHSLYSPVRVFASLVDSEGREVESRHASPVFTGVSGYRNYDTVIVAENLEQGDYFLRLSASYLSSFHYPAGMVALDSVPFVVVTASANQAEPAHSGSTAYNARCQANESFAAYISPGGEPFRQDLDGGGGFGFCGSVAVMAAGAMGNGGRGPRGGGDGPSAGAIAGWFAPWVLMLAATRLARTGAARSRRRSVALCTAHS